MDPFIGEIRPVPYNFAPQGWAFCQGQIMSIAQNTALFSLLGTTFGGNGVTTFGLPDLRSRVPLGAGAAYQTFDLGEVGGEPTVTLDNGSIPNHNHGVTVSPFENDSSVPPNTYPGLAATPVYEPAAGGMFAADAITIAGQNAPHNNLQPYTTINYIIALQGVFPQRP